jgi:methylated-DNA-[protein]-cysteine S-methyltransferase
MMEQEQSLALMLDRMVTPIGIMVLVFDDQERLRALDWQDHEARFLSLLKRHYGQKDRDFAIIGARLPDSLRVPMERYFSGDIGAIDAIPVHCHGSEFQKTVWSELRRIPGGTTISYGQLAVRIGKPNAMRAVGLANGANPISIVVPCHRVIGANGTLTGYGGGLARKKWLLAHEGAHGFSCTPELLGLNA